MAGHATFGRLEGNEVAGFVEFQIKILFPLMRHDGLSHADSAWSDKFGKLGFCK